jgi:hypothetical protein
MDVHEQRRRREPRETETGTKGKSFIDVENL